MNIPAKKQLFCFGLGYVAAALATRLGAAGWEISGTTRDPGGMTGPWAGSIEIFDGTRPLGEVARRLATASHLLLSIPPGPDGDPVAALHGGDIAALRGLRWLGYLSTTGPYGDRGGDWVDETTPPAPTGERGRRRLRAERQWLEAWRDHGVPVHVFRLAAIYGPGRNQFEALAKGRARRIVKPGQVFSRIHIDDLTAVLEASIARPNPGAIYNVCDDEPAPPWDVVTFAAELAGVAPPPEIAFEQAEMSDMARGFYAENKRVRNTRIKTELGVRLRYPSYREGLRALWAKNKNQAQGNSMDDEPSDSKNH